MRIFAVSASSICILSVWCRMALASSRPTVHPIGDGNDFEIPPFDFKAATMGQKVVYLAVAGEAQAAIEHFLAMPNDASKFDATVMQCYSASMMDFVAFPNLTTWVQKHNDRNLSDSDKVRAFWGGADWDGVIAHYEESEDLACKTDSRATAAYLDAKLRKAFPALTYPAVEVPVSNMPIYWMLTEVTVRNSEAGPSG